MVFLLAVAVERAVFPGGANTEFRPTVFEAGLWAAAGFPLPGFLEWVQGSP